MPRLQLVITADDLGLDPLRDEGIFAAHAAGAITQASLLVAGPSAPMAAQRACQQGLPLGLHLDLTELPALALRSRVRSLLGVGGEKLGKHGLRAALARGEVAPDQVEVEVAAQLEAFEQLTGRRPLHVDGHQHVHIVPQLTGLLAALFASAGVRTLRIPEERETGRRDAFHHSVSRQAAEARAVYSRQGLRSTRAFVGLEQMGFQSTVAGLVDAVRATLNDGSVELMCHVGFTGTLGDEFNRSPAREHELRVLCALPFKALVVDGSVELSSFEQAFERSSLC